ncbi:MAG: serine/threonine protein kinase [Actinomycetota bacterium]|nr:serine/threonine protein kinase [Actinomycetota bacterium]
MSEVLAGRYELGASLGAGGMGRVVTARDRVLDRTVAVKLVPVEQARSADPALAARFVAEARTTARFTHRNVVTVYDAGESDGYLYIVSEFINGTTLAHRLDQQGPLGIDESVRVGGQLLRALGAAHAAGIVHRDVKPSNILLDTNGNVKLADFGIAKRLDDLEAAVTAAGQFVGTPRYVAPEQAAGERATAATDLYAVGVVMYEMLSGEAPFDAETPMATLLAHRDAPVPDVRQARPEVPAAMAAAITTAMAKRPEDRFDSAEEMRTALTTSSSSSIGADPTVAGVAVPLGATVAYSSLDPLLVPPPGAFSEGGEDGVGELDPERRSGNQMWWWAAVAILLIVGIVAIAQAGGGDDPGGGDANADDSRPRNAAPGATDGASTQAPSTPTGPPSSTRRSAQRTAAPTPPPTAAPTPPPTATPSTTPPPTEPPATETPPPLIPELPADLSGLIDALGADPSALGARGEDLLSELEDVADEDSEDQSKAAAKTIRELDKWVRDGELDPGAAATIRAVLVELADENQGNNESNGNGGDGNGNGGEGNGNGNGNNDEDGDDD